MKNTSPTVPEAVLNTLQEQAREALSRLAGEAHGRAADTELSHEERFNSHLARDLYRDALHSLLKAASLPHQ